MKIDYFAILRTLYEFKIAKQVGAKANSLLLALIWKANVMHFPDTLAIWNSEVRDLAGLSEEELISARNRLITLRINGQSVVTYESGGTRRPGKYSLNYPGLTTFFQNRPKTTPDITPENPGNVPGNSHGNVQGNPPGNLQGNENSGLVLIPGGCKYDETPSTTNKRTKQTNKQFTSDSPEYTLAAYMLQKILQLNATFKMPNMQKWASSMDKIMRIDQRPYEEIKAVIDYVYSSWWKDKVLSPDKLREKYDTLNMQRPRQSDGEEGDLIEWGWKKEKT